LKKHVFHCCSNDECSICKGGLYYCVICKGGEGSLPTECPHRELTREEIDLIYKGRLDFVEDKWVIKS